MKMLNHLEAKQKKWNSEGKTLNIYVQIKKQNILLDFEMRD